MLILLLIEPGNSSRCRVSCKNSHFQLRYIAILCCSLAASDCRLCFLYSVI